MEVHRYVFLPPLLAGLLIISRLPIFKQFLQVHATLNSTTGNCIIKRVKMVLSPPFSSPLHRSMTSALYAALGSFPA